MITPKFKLEQDDNYLYVQINAPYAKINDTDISIDDNDFRFYSKPYYLRLNLPGKILDSENESGTYDFDQNMFKFKFEKATKGEIFKDLDLLTKLLTPALNKDSSKPLVEEIEAPEQEDSGDEWFVDQIDNSNEENENITLNSFNYGFAHKKSNVFSKLSEEYGLIIDIPSPDTCSYEERTQLRVNIEQEKFNDEHYLADLYDNDYISECLLTFEPFWYKINDDKSPETDYTDDEIDSLKNLPKKSFILDKNEKLMAYTGLVDILYAYCYNYRINCGETNSEDGWTIAKLSATLSWFEVRLQKFTSFEDLVKCSIRRSLCFPLYRHWKLSKQVLKDVIQILSIGRKLILKCLLQIRATFNKGDCRYLLNDLYITDYCVWIQYSKEKRLKEISDILKNIKISKEMVGFDLECLEAAGKLAIENPNVETDISSQSSDDDAIEESLKNLKISPENTKKPLIIELN